MSPAVGSSTSSSSSFERGLLLAGLAAAAADGAAGRVDATVAPRPRCCLVLTMASSSLRQVATHTVSVKPSRESCFTCHSLP